jgi:hypothetical protein
MPGDGQFDKVQTSEGEKRKKQRGGIEEYRKPHIATAMGEWG